jgi:hypothetical protein
MTGFLLKSICIVAVICTILTVTAGIIGKMKPVNPMIEGFRTDCVEPYLNCWYGIKPAKTTVSDLESITVKFGLSKMVQPQFKRLYFKDQPENCFVNFRQYDDISGVLDNFFFGLTGCEKITLADFIGRLGSPDYVEQGCNDGTYYHFMNGLVRVKTISEWIAPALPISDLSLNSKSFMRPPEQIYRWEGLFSIQYYHIHQGDKHCVDRG